MEKTKTILIATPTSSYKDYCLESWAKHLSKCITSDCKLLVIDNSKDAKYQHRLRSVLNNNGIDNEVVRHYTECDDIRVLMCECNNISREYLLANNYKYMLSLESDIYPPIGFIERLLSHDREVVGLQYFISQYHASIPVTSLDVAKYFKMLNMINQTCLDGFIRADGKLREVSAIGLGCVLIKRSVLEDIGFRVDDSEWKIDTDNHAHADTFFHIDLMKNGIPIYLDTYDICRHDNTSWKKIYDEEKEKNRKV